MLTCINETRALRPWMVLPTYTTDELFELADRHFRRLVLRCPRCQARVQGVSRSFMNRRGARVDLECRRCGAYGRYEPDWLDGLDLEWSPNERNAIVENYWKSGCVDCPTDSTRLSVREGQNIGGPPFIDVRCERCDRRFRSTGLESPVEASEDTEFKRKYEVIRQLGRGGMGVVELVRCRKTGRTFAAKSIKEEHIRQAGTHVKRFTREIRLLGKSPHRNLVSIHDYYLAERPILVMEYCSEGTLAEKINDPAISEQQLWSWFDDTLAGLEHLHQNQIVHRDVKPSNILIGSDGCAQIADLGLGMLSDRAMTTLTATNQALGTARYMAPEQWKSSKEVDRRADLYSLALVVYEIATRNSPYQPPISIEGCKTELRDLITKGLAVEPADRPGIREFRKRLRRSRPQ